MIADNYACCSVTGKTLNSVLSSFVHLASHVMPNLLNFEWFKDPEGYQIVETKEETGWKPQLFIRPRSKRRTQYRPLDNHPALFREFAETAENPEAILGFANKFGLLTHPPEDESSDHFGMTDLSTWYGIIWEMKGVIAEWELGRRQGDVVQTIESFSSLEWSWFDQMPLVEVRLSASADPVRPFLSLVPSTLMAAMWIQFAQAVASGIQLRRCAVCPTWFVFGTGTGRRNSANYCSDRCRKAAHRARKLSG